MKISNDNESIIDYCNHALQTRFLLLNTIRLLQKDEQIKHRKYSNQIVNLLYNINVEISFEIYRDNSLTTEISEKTELKQLISNLRSSFENIKKFYLNVLKDKKPQD